MRRPWPRRALLTILLILCAVLTLFPERYRVAMTMTPSDPSSLGLSGALGQLGAFNSVFTNQAALELTLRVGRSIAVRQIVIERLGLVKKMGFTSELQAQRWLTNTVDVNIRSLRGGIVQMEVYQSDPVFGRTLINAYADATRQRLALVNRQQTEYKRDILLQLVRDASDRVARAQSAYDTFRLQTRYSQPNSSIEAIGERIPVLQARIKATEVELNAARQFATDDNLSIRQILARLQALNGQLQQAQAVNPVESNSVGRVVQQSTQVRKLERELGVARSLYDSYTRYLEGTAVEDLTSAANLRVLEPAFIDSARQYNVRFAALGLLIVLIGFAVEFYQLRRPVGDRPAAS